MSEKLTAEEKAYHKKLEREKEKRAQARQLAYWKQLDEEHQQRMLLLKQVQALCKQLTLAITEASAIVKHQRIQITKYRKK